MEPKKVSIILCFYNEEKYLAKAIDSVFEQTYSNFELILVSDGSTDRSREIADSYNDARIKKVYLEKNGGLANARNAGYEVATGDYIAHFDGDDILLPQKLAVEVEYLNSHPDILVVSGGYYTMDGDGVIASSPTYPLLHSDTEIRAGQLFGSYVANAGASMFRSSLVKDYGVKNNPDIHWCEDFHFWHQSLPYGKFANLDETFFCYRINYGSITNKLKKEKENIYFNSLFETLKFGWSNRGFTLSDKDIWFFINHFFRRKVILPHEFSYKNKLRNKIESQSLALELPESKEIMSMFHKKTKERSILTTFAKKTRKIFK